MSKVEYVGKHRALESETFETRSSTSMWARRVLAPLSAFVIVAFGFGSVAFAEQPVGLKNETHVVVVDV